MDGEGCMAGKGGMDGKGAPEALLALARSAPARLRTLLAHFESSPAKRSLRVLGELVRHPGITARLAIAFVVVAVLAVAVNLIVEHGVSIIETTTTTQAAPVVKPRAAPAPIAAPVAVEEIKPAPVKMIA